MSSIDNIRTFLEVATTGNFNRAAYLVYPTDAQDPATLEIALDGLRQIAQQERES